MRTNLKRMKSWSISGGLAILGAFLSSVGFFSRGILQIQLEPTTELFTDVYIEFSNRLISAFCLGISSYKCSWFDEPGHSNLCSRTNDLTVPLSLSYFRFIITISCDSWL